MRFLTEFLNYFSAAGERKRSVVAEMFEETMSHALVFVIPQTRESLLRGFTLYKARADKSYSLTDCISMIAMRERNITEVLTHDRHFWSGRFHYPFLELLHPFKPVQP